MGEELSQVVVLDQDNMCKEQRRGTKAKDIIGSE